MACRAYDVIVSSSLQVNSSSNVLPDPADGCELNNIAQTCHTFHYRNMVRNLKIQLGANVSTPDLGQWRMDNGLPECGANIINATINNFYST